jgi:hypothetical protein
MSVIRCDLCQCEVDTDIESTYEACEGCAVDYDGQASEHPKLAELEKDRARLDWIMAIIPALCREAIDTDMEADR